MKEKVNKQKDKVRKYQSIDETKKERIIELREYKLKTYTEISKELGISKSTVSQIYYDWKNNKPKKSKQKSINLLKEEHLEFIREMIDEDPNRLMEEDIQQGLVNKFGEEFKIGISILAKFINNNCAFTIKRNQKVLNEQAIIDGAFNQVHFVSNLKHGNIDFKNQCIYIEQTSFKLFTLKANHGNNKGVIAKTRLTSKDRNISSIAAINLNGIQYLESNRGITDENSFLKFMYKLLKLLDKNNLQSQTIIINNCSTYKNAALDKLLQVTKHNFIFLPLLSTYLNPIDNLFNKVPNIIKRTPLTDVDVLLDEIKQKLEQTTTVECQNWIDNAIQNWIDNAIQNMDLFNNNSLN